MKNIIKLFLLLISLSVAGQTVSMEEAVAIALTNHPVARNIALTERKGALLHIQAAPTQVRYWQRGTMSGNDRIWSVTQDFGSIPAHFRQVQHNRTSALTRQAESALTLDELEWRVKAAYLDLVYHELRLQTMLDHAHYFEALISLAEINLFPDSLADALVKVSTGIRYGAYQRSMYIAEEEFNRAEIRLRQLMYIHDGKIVPRETELYLYQIHPNRQFYERFDPIKRNSLSEAQLNEAKSAVNLEKSKLFPAIHAGYIHQNIEGVSANYQGWMVGLSVPLWTQLQRTRIKEAEIDVIIAANVTEYRQFADRQYAESLRSLLNEYFVQISFSRENSLIEAELILEEIKKDFSEGRINDFAEAFTKLNAAVYAKLNHMEYMNLYNQTALELEYYTQ